MDAKRSYTISSPAGSWSLVGLSDQIPTPADAKQELRAGLGALVIHIKPLDDDPLVKVATLRKFHRYCATEAVREGLRYDLGHLPDSIDGATPRMLASKLLAVVMPPAGASVSDGQAICVGDVRVLAGLVKQMRSLVADEATAGRTLGASEALTRVLEARASALTTPSATEFATGTTSSSPEVDAKETDAVNYVPVPPAKGPAKPPHG